MSGIRSSAPARYAVALAVTAASVMVRWSLEPVWGVALPFITLFPAVMFSAWFGGLGPGILATVISFMAAAYLWTQPTGSWSVRDPGEMLGLAVFAAVGIVFSVLNEASRRTAAALLESVERSRVTLASIGDAVVVTDAQGKVTSMNRIAEELTGWSAADVIGKPIADVMTIVDESSRRPVPNPVERALRDGMVTGLANHTVLLARDQRETPIDDSAAPIRGAGGETVGAVIVFRNVAERRKAELNRDAAERTARELAAIVATSDDAIVSKDLDSTILSWNAAAERMFGYTAAEAVGRSIRLIIPDARANEEDEVLARLRAGERVDHFETVRRRKDGRDIQVSLSISPIRDARGAVVGASKIARDITALKQGEAALRAADERRAFLLRLSDALRQIAGAAEIQGTASRMLGQHLGVSRCMYADVEGADAIVRKAYTDGVAPLPERVPYDAFGEAMAVLYRRGEPVAIDDVNSDERLSPAERDRLRGAQIGALAASALLKNGRLVAFFGVHHREPRRWRAEEVSLVDDVAKRTWEAVERARAEEQLRDANARKDEFLAMLAHELRNPLAPIRTGLELIRLGGDTPGAVARVRAMIERQVAHMVRLIDDLLDVSRITSGKIRLQRAPTPLASVIENAVDANRSGMSAKRIRLSVTVPDQLCVIDVDPTRIVQVLSNLLHNAAKFTEAGGEVSVSAVAPDGNGQWVTISVRDSGIGIAPDLLPRVFELFTQGETGSSQPGLGIGLALARRLVELHGGRLDARSEGTGRGSEFVLELPVAVTTCVSAVAHPADEDSAGRRILVVDDNADAALATKMLVEAVGGEARVALNGEAALEVLKHYDPDVILLDIGMRGLDGYETCRRMRDVVGKHVVIAALSGFGRDDDKERGRRAGFDVHVTKPADPAVLKKLLARGAPAPEA